MGVEDVVGDQALGLTAVRVDDGEQIMSQEPRPGEGRRISDQAAEQFIFGKGYPSLPGSQRFRCD